MDNSSVAGKESVSSGNSAIENEELSSSASLCTSAIQNMAAGSGKILQSKKSKKRGRVFDRHSRAAELEVCCLVCCDLISARVDSKISVLSSTFLYRFLL